MRNKNAKTDVLIKTILWVIFTLIVIWGIIWLTKFLTSQ